MKLNDRETATVIAALRFWQRLGGPAMSDSEPEHDILTDGGALDALTADEIDALIEERINAEPPVGTPEHTALVREALGIVVPPTDKIIITVSGGVAEVNTNPSGMEIEIVDFDGIEAGDPEPDDPRVREAVGLPNPPDDALQHLIDSAKGE